MRRRGKTDGNQTRLVKFLNDLGALVADTSGLGEGFPDLVVGWRGDVYLVEVKNDAMPPSKRGLTDAEQNFHARWKHIVPARLWIVKDEDEVLAMLGLIRPGEVVNGPRMAHAAT
jgi:hypothetical protein